MEKTDTLSLTYKPGCKPKFIQQELSLIFHQNTGQKIKVPFQTRPFQKLHEFHFQGSGKLPKKTETAEQTVSLTLGILVTLLPLKQAQIKSEG